MFAGIGGVELGLQRAGMQSELLCEWWEPAQAVLKHHFAEVPLVGDVRDIDKLPSVDLVAAGFPCTDLSQAGRTSGIRGEACLFYTSPSPRDRTRSRMPSSA